MKIGRHILGLGLTPKLLLAGACLLIIPWLGLETLQAMQRFLIDGQSQAQLLTARGIATLLHGRDDLFIEPDADSSDFAEIPLYPLAGKILLDGYDEDWQELGGQALVFGNEDSTRFSVLLGQSGEYIYALVRVRDSSPVHRHPAYLRLDHSDHLRLYTNDLAGQPRRHLLTFEGNGQITAYAMDNAWQLADPGHPEYRIRGQARIMDDGYQLEIALPQGFVSSHNAHLGLAVADVTDQHERRVRQLVATFPSIEQGRFNRLIIRSAETERILESLATSDARIWVLDRQLRVRAAVGKLHHELAEFDFTGAEAGATTDTLGSLLLNRLTGTLQVPVGDFHPRQTHSREDSLLRSALSGDSGVSTRMALDGQHVVVAAAHPIRDRDERSVIGVVLLEQTTNAILKLQSLSFRKIVLLTLGGLIAVSAFVLLFSSRLTWRIKRLGSDTQKASDEQGRMRNAHPFRGRYAGDEIGDLTRQIEQLLARLARYQQFLIAVPRTLRHEINNPLSTVSTSLQHLETSPDDQRFLDSARRGIHRIATITDGLAEAANLEEALSTDDMEVFDLTQLLKNYVDNQHRQHQRRIDLDLPRQAVMLRGSDMHIEQLLDKLLDNAVDFSLENKAIEVRLATDRNQCFLSITNHGPRIPEAQLPELFQLFHSRREQHPDTQGLSQHLGLGLYIARLICERHGGDLRAENLKQTSGVVVTARLPLAA